MLVIRARAEDGFTLIEMMTAMVIGGMVLGALMLVFVRATAATTEAQNRIETGQNARLTMDHLTQLLDSQTCLLIGTGDDSGNVDSDPPIVAASTNSVTFYADQNASASSDSPDKYMLTYDPTAKTITESKWTATGVEPSIGYTNAPTVRTIATSISPARGEDGSAQPIFSYYTFPLTGSAAPVALTPGSSGTLTQRDAGTVTQIVIQFQPTPRLSGAEDSNHSNNVRGEAYLQTADPTLQAVCP